MSIERKSMVTIQPRRLCLASLAGLSYLDHRFLLPVILSIATSRRTQNHSALVSLVALWDHPQLYNSARFVSPIATAQEFRLKRAVIHPTGRHIQDFTA